MTALLVFLLSLPSPDWSALGISAAAAAALVWWELRAGNPFIDVGLLTSNLALTRTYLRYGLTLLGVYVVCTGSPNGSRPLAACPPTRRDCC